MNMRNTIIIAAILVIAAFAVKCGQQRSALKNAEIYVCGLGEGNDLIKLLYDEEAKVKEYESPESALEKAKPGSAVLLLAGDYPEKPLIISEDNYNIIEEKGLRVYAEFADVPALRLRSGTGKSGSGTGGDGSELKEIGVERIVVTKPLGDSLKPMDLLTINRAVYLKTEAADPLMVIARVAGFDSAVFGLEDTPSSPLVYKPSDNIWISTAKLSDFAHLRLIPERKWQPFWETVISDLTGRKVTMLFLAVSLLPNLC